jgi:hypothetical protein
MLVLELVHIFCARPAGRRPEPGAARRRRWVGVGGGAAGYWYYWLLDWGAQRALASFLASLALALAQARFLSPSTSSAARRPAAPARLRGACPAAACRTLAKKRLRAE